VGLEGHSRRVLRVVWVVSGAIVLAAAAVDGRYRWLVAVVVLLLLWDAAAALRRRAPAAGERPAG